MELSEELERRRQESAISVNELATLTNIPRTTLIRCLNDPGQFKLSQFIAVTRALNMPSHIEAA